VSYPSKLSFTGDVSPKSSKITENISKIPANYYLGKRLDSRYNYKNGIFP
jgi:hypothetical protein